MSEQEQKVLSLCRKWYSNAENITMQTLWYEIGVMVENEQPFAKVSVNCKLAVLELFQTMVTVLPD